MPGWARQSRVHRTIQDVITLLRAAAQLKTYELLTSRIFHLIFSDAIDHGKDCPVEN
jgi:hypothetical protein